MKILITLSLGLMIAQTTFAQSNVEFFAGTIHEKDTERSLGLVCADQECKTLKFLKMDGRIAEGKLGATFDSETYPSKRDVALTNYSMFVGHSQRDAKEFRQRILSLTGSTSKIVEVSTVEFEQAYDFAKRFDSLATLKIAGRIDERGSERSISTICIDEACSFVSIILKNDALDSGITLSTISRANTESLKIHREVYRGGRGLFRTIRYLTVGKSGKKGYFGQYLGDNDTMLGVLFFGTIIGYNESYAVAVTGTAVAGAVTTILETPFVLIRGLVAPLPHKKIETFKSGGNITLGTQNFNRVIDSIKALK